MPLEQLTLDFDSVTTAHGPSRDDVENLATEHGPRTIQERFEVYHRQNPQVFDLFKRFAYEAKAAGRERFGGKAIWERLRWHCSIEKGGDDPRLNNVYVSRYVRLLCEECPDLADLFEQRVLKSR